MRSTLSANVWFERQGRMDDKLAYWKILSLIKVNGIRRLQSLDTVEFVRMSAGFFFHIIFYSPDCLERISTAVYRNLLLSLKL